MNIQHTHTTNTTIIYALIALVCGLIIGFSVGAVFGLPATYDQTVSITKNATNLTEGFAINAYIENVKADICETLNNNMTAKQECLNI